jgi:hypothetical protein
LQPELRARRIAAAAAADVINIVNEFKKKPESPTAALTIRLRYMATRIAIFELRLSF